MESRFIRACRRKAVDCTPVWMMRQAGRYLPEYRELRRRYEMLDLCKTPELACRITLQPLRRFPFDAAIVFADILLPLEGMGLEFGFESGRGPVIERPLQGQSDIERLRSVEPEADLGYVLETLRLVRAELDPAVALIGFAGAPFTLASYMIEGGKSRHFKKTKELAYREPQLWDRLMTLLAESTVLYLRAQAEAGADAIQLFDSWVGCLAPNDYLEYVQPHLEWIFEQLDDLETPTVYFGTNTFALLPSIGRLGSDVVGVDWRTPLDQAWEAVGPGKAVQGNLDPVALFAPAERLEEEVDRVLREAAGRAGHIFNLGHGVLPETPLESIEAVVRWVHEKTSRR